MSDTKSARTEYGAEVLRMLWPAAQVQTRTNPSSGSDQTHRQWLPLPSMQHPKMLVPVGVPAAARMLNRSDTTQRRVKSAVRALVQQVVASGRIGQLPLARFCLSYEPGPASDEASIADHLVTALEQPLDIGILLGAHRANQKPVLQLFGRRGDTVAFVKVGHNSMARALVRQETKTLRLLAEAHLTSVRTPEVLHASVWNDLEVLVLSPLSSERKVGGHQREVPLRALREIAHVCGTTHEALANSCYWARARDLPVPELSRSLSMLAEKHGHQVLEFGSWHGDWAPWNMNRTGQVAEVWDWERFERDVPVGFDALHFEIQAVRHDSPRRHEQETKFLNAAPAVLSALGVPARITQLTLVLYLLSIAQRYVLASGCAPESPLTPRTRWAIGLLQRELDKLLRQASEKGTGA